MKGLESWKFPFLLVLGGIILDFATTTIGLTLFSGMYEIFPRYNPFWALTIFWISLTILTISLPRNKNWRLCINGIASISYIGALNNIFVLFGLFPGLIV